MSSHSTSNKKQQTAASIRQAKGSRKLSMLTAYDYAMAAILDESGIDMILVGDSLGMVMLGHEDTVNVSLADMAHHARAVVAATKQAMVVVDMPFMTYEPGVSVALENAAWLIKQSGARAVKLEGGSFIVPQIKALVQCGIAVMGHLGLMPQRAATLGGFKVQAKSLLDAEALLEEARALEEAGCFALVLEAVPTAVASYVSAHISIPTIGIGAGLGCDGQVLVLHDMLGLTKGHIPRFAKQYADVRSLIGKAVKEYMTEVTEGLFPATTHSFTMPEEDELELLRRVPYGHKRSS